MRAHLVSDVPVRVLLGGIDSSALTALAAEESSERVSTFSIGFEKLLRRARQRAAGRAAVWHRSPRAGPAARRGRSSCRWWRRSTSRSRTRRLCPPTWSRSSRPNRSRWRSGGGPTSSSAATTPTSPISSLPGGPVCAGGLAAGPQPAELVGEGELRLQGKALRQWGPAAAARAPPRLEGDLLRRCARRAAQRGARQPPRSA